MDERERWSLARDRREQAESRHQMATNPKARDFRLGVIGPAYAATPLVESSPGVYVVRVPKPDAGFTAFFVQLEYESGSKNPFKFTTEVSILPDVLPFKWEDAKAKYPLVPRH
jgi:PhoPQ-activated pathogenicity-related protein